MRKRAHALLLLCAALSLGAASPLRESFLKAVTDLQARRFASARKGFEAVLVAQPGQLEALYYLGQALYHLGDLDGAKARFQAAAKADPSMPVTHYYLGRIAYDRGDLAAAFAALRQADELDAELPMVHYYLGLVYQGNQQSGPAALEFEKALSLQPDLGRAALAAAALRWQMLKEPEVALKLAAQAAQDKDPGIRKKARALEAAIKAR
jgi:tetratricopeptide (TPR) repeat protein